MLSAELEYFQYPQDIGNQTSKDHLFFCYYNNLGLGLSDYTTNDLEAYILYSIETYNNTALDPTKPIDNCNFLIKYLNRTSSPIILNQTFTPSDYNVLGAKYFFKMKVGDCVSADITCKYESYANLTHPYLDIPATMQLVTPTKECKACQMAEWSNAYRKIEIAQHLNSNRVSIVDYIYKLIMLNFEFLLALWWIFLILMIFVAIGLIFILAYWLYLYLRKVGK